MAAIYGGFVLNLNTWSILCDFDGTIALRDVTDLLLERFARPGWEEIEARWERGEIGSRVCMQQQIALLDVDRGELEAALDAVPIDPEFPRFVAEVLARGWPLAVVSDGLDLAIHHILARYTLPPLTVFANRLRQAGPRAWRLDAPAGAGSCRVDSGTCKCARARLARHETSRVLLIGDGASDFCAAGAVDLVFAKGKLQEYCRRESLPFVPIGGFADACAALPQLAAEGERFFSLETLTHES